MQAISDFAEERVTREEDSVSFTCSNLSSAENSVVWLYTPGEAYENVQHIYTDGRMLSRWTSKCNVTTNATASTLVLDSVHSDSAGYYECSEEHFNGYDVRFRVKLVVLGGYLYSHVRLVHQQALPTTTTTTTCVLFEYNGRPNSISRLLIWGLG